MHKIESAYLAGPMRGLPRYNFDAFEEAALNLEGEGIAITSPHRMDLGLGFDPDSTDELVPEFVEECVRRDVNAIILTSAVIFLPGWTLSVGAMAEYHVARWLGRPCFQYPNLDLISAS